MSEKKKNAAEEIGTLGSCLMEGDPEQKARERKIKRRALSISVALQCAAIVALVLIPLLGKTEKLPNTLFIPIPNYYQSKPKPVDPVREVQPIRHHWECVTCITTLSPHPSTHSTYRAPEEPDGSEIEGIGIASQPTGLEGIGRGKGPLPPPDQNPTERKRITVGGAVQQAMLVRRVDPVYPPLAKQIGKSGVVHLHALISTDGSIESLRVIDGDPFLVKSALDAVAQWRYKPTMLNGQPVEVETVITVVYTLSR